MSLLYEVGSHTCVAGIVVTTPVTRVLLYSVMSVLCVRLFVNMIIHEPLEIPSQNFQGIIQVEWVEKFKNGYSGVPGGDLTSLVF